MNNRAEFKNRGNATSAKRVLVEKITRVLIDFVHETEPNDLPDSVIEKAKLVFLDSVGCSVAAHSTQSGKICMDLVADQGGRAEATIIGGGRTSCKNAAFVNGILINALEFDSNLTSLTHVAPYVIPACLAGAERSRSNGRDFLTACVLSFDIAARIGSSIQPDRYVTGKHPDISLAFNPRFSYAPAVFGATLGVCKLLGLSADQMANAFGYAGSNSPIPTMTRWISKPHSSHNKYGTSTGWVAELAVTAALLAQKGFTADQDILDGDYGYSTLIGSDMWEPERAIRDLGKKWFIEESRFKPYPVCSLFFYGIDCLRKIMTMHNLQPDEIQSVIVKADPSLQQNVWINSEINDYLDAQFSNQFVYALAVYYGHEPRLKWQSKEALEDPRVREFMRRVTVVEKEDFLVQLYKGISEGNPRPKSSGSMVEVKARNKIFKEEEEYAWGSTQNPMSSEDIIEKFKANCMGNREVNTEAIRRIVDRTISLDTCEDMTEYTQSLTESSLLGTTRRDDNL